MDHFGTDAVRPNDNPYRTFQAGDSSVALPMVQPVLTVWDLDRLVAARLDEALIQADQREREACERAWNEGHRAGFQDGIARTTELTGSRIDEIVRRQLYWISKRVTDRAGRQLKTTIAAEREFMAAQATALDDAISDLRNVA